MAEVDRNSYSSILKSIGLFGGVKVFQILVSILKNKLVAILLGPVGMGISGMITSTTSLVNSLFSFGLHTSSVREIAKAVKNKDEQGLSKIIYTLRRIILLTGLLGTVVTFICAPILSQISFGNGDYTLPFRIVSIILLLDQLSMGQTAIMQGTFNYKYMASSNMIGSLLGLCISVPFYYLWGQRAIVPVIVVSSLSQLLLTYYFSKKVKVIPFTQTLKETFIVGKGMIVLGFAIALSGILTSAQTYVLRGFIANFGSIADIGLYMAGIAIATQYIDVILQAMGTDYSPRLASVSDDNDAFISVINRQINLMITLVTPFIITFILFVSQLITLLYSTKFLPIIGMVEWVMFGMFFRAFSWCMSYSMIAKGESKTFFVNELLTKCYSLGFSILGYYFYGFTGMGIAFCLTYICYSVHMFMVCRNKYKFYINANTIRISLISLFMMLIAFVTLKLLGYSIYRYVLGSVLLLLIWFISLKILNKMIPLKGIYHSIINKIRR